MEDLMEPPAYREAAEFGERKSIRKILQIRFKEGLSTALIPLLNQIQDLEKLEFLIEKAVIATTLQDFESCLTQTLQERSP
jgi:hypothetical protein